jgi:transposase
MQPLGEEVSAQLGRIMAACRVIRTIRRKKICAGCHRIAQPPAPSLPIQRSIAHPTLLADIFVSKTVTCARRPTRRKKHSTISASFAIESTIRGKPPAKALRMRQENAKPLLETYEAWLRAKLKTLPSKSETAKATNYSRGELATATYSLIGNRKLNGIRPRT